MTTFADYQRKQARLRRMHLAMTSFVRRCDDDKVVYLSPGFRKAMRQPARKVKLHHTPVDGYEPPIGTLTMMRRANMGNVRVVHAPGRSDRAYHGGQFREGEW